MARVTSGRLGSSLSSAQYSGGLARLGRAGSEEGVRVPVRVARQDQDGAGLDVDQDRRADPAVEQLVGGSLQVSVEGEDQIVALGRTVRRSRSSQSSGVVTGLARQLFVVGGLQTGRAVLERGVVADDVCRLGSG